MKGWVYIISNKGMPGLIKVGYSMQDPKIRAQQMNNEGVPHPHIVDYEILIENPKLIEKKVHRALLKFHEGKEWFRCSCEEAIIEIKKISCPDIIIENYIRANREKAERILKEREEEKEERAKKEQLEREQKEKIEAQILQRKKEINEYYEKQIKNLLIPFIYKIREIIGFSCLATLVFLVIMFILTNLFSIDNETWSVDYIFLICIVGGFVSVLIAGYFYDGFCLFGNFRTKKSARYKTLISQQKKELESIREEIKASELSKNPQSHSEFSAYQPNQQSNKENIECEEQTR
ncbi:MAG: GIY-YIG nuclease family protein [Candidatus Brocadiaceae bacterium]|nr:GIY-YIG nuclease family protein [Candidatus Brocadiaceae bacterium]